MRLIVITCACVAAIAAVPSGLAQQQHAPSAGHLAAVERVFRNPPEDARPMMRWWWFGPAVKKAEIARELRVMRDAGIGGVEIQPVYPLALDDPRAGVRNMPFLSGEFLDALAFAAQTGGDLGMRVDVTLGSGWPYGGPGVSIDRAAGMLRVERVPLPPGTTRVPLPAIGGGEQLIRAFVVPAGDEASVERAIPPDEMRDDAVLVPASSGTRVLLCFIAGRTGMQVKRAAVGAEGFVLDHYSRAALDAYLAAVGEPLLRAFGTRPPFSIFCDSLEVFGSDWTADLLDEFRRRRGYDLAPLLPVLASDTAPRSADVREDWGRTLAELYEERFIAPLQAWAHRRGTKLRIQGYGTPHATLGSNRFADLPEGEGWQWKALRPSRWASSVAHLYDRPVVSSETWTWVHSPVFRATPLDLKAEADLHFLQGITQIIGHGWPYSPGTAAYPGWQFYAAGAFDDRNPWFFAMPDLTRYLQRVSAVLRQGSSAADVALYVPTADAWSSMAPGRMRYLNELLRERIGDAAIARTIEAGFAFDLFDDDVLQRHGTVEDSGLRLGRRTYGVVILPNVRRLPLETARTIEAFAARGGAVIATMQWPDCAPGFLASDADHARVRVHMDAVARHERARLVSDPAMLGKALAEVARPDLRVSDGQEAIGFLHRRLADADVYFVANTSPAPLDVMASLRVVRRRGEAWDPTSGAIEPIAAEPDPADRARMRLRLRVDAYGSRLIVFSDRSPAPGRAPQEVVESLDVSDEWYVRFGAEEGGTTMPRLQSWTERPETRFFSGVATYERDVTVPAAALQSGSRAMLDLGEGRPGPPTPPGANGFRAAYEAPVREAAEVWVNGTRAGVAWHPPYVVDVTDVLRPGPNRILIRVGNLAVNQMAARARPSLRLLALRYGQRFENQDQDQIVPVPAGLLGPIRLVVRR